MQLPSKCRVPLRASSALLSPPAPPPREKEMFVFYIYGDDSGKFKDIKAEYTSLCGYVGHVSEWQRFGMEWTNLRMHWQVPPIHMREMMRGVGKWEKTKTEWGSDWETKRHDMLLQFGAVIRDSHLACVGAVVDAAYYRSLPPSEFHKAMPDSVHLAFHQLVMRGIDKTEVVDRCSPIGIVIDDDRDSYGFCYQVLDGLRSKFPKVKERISSISFGNDDAFPGLQASDMIAYEARNVMVKNKGQQVIDPSNVPELYGYLTFFGIHQPKMYTPEILDSLNSRPLSKGDL